MLSPFLLIGVGGSGGKTLRAVRQKLDMRLRLAGWENGLPDAWQFLHFDTPVVQDGNNFPSPFLPQESYVGLATANGNYPNIVTAIEAPLNKDFIDEAMRQIPNPAQVQVPVTKGAGQFRGVGRAVALARLKQIGDAAKLAVSKSKAPDSLAQLARLSELFGSDAAQGTSAEPIVVFVSSIAGGSGAGQYLDVVDAVRTQFTAESTNWAESSFGILYAPDVFDGITGAGGIPGNALATVSETVNGHANHNLDDSVVAMFRAQGLTVSTGGPNDRVGVAYPLIVGRQSANTSFANEKDVYLSIASTISAWMSNDSFQDSIEAYFKTNYSANQAPDNTGFTEDAALNSPPLGAIGFGRVTLGRESFLEYSKERLTRSAIDRLLNAHVIDSRDLLLKNKSESAYRKESIADKKIQFLEASGFNEETEEKDQVIDFLRNLEDQNSRKIAFSMAVADHVSTQVDSKTGGLDANQWVDRLEAARGALINKYLIEDRQSRAENYTKWVTEAPEKLFKAVSNFAILNGLPVTAGLLEELSSSVSKAADELERESRRHIEWTAGLRGYLVSDLSTSGQAAVIRIGSDPYNMAIARMGESFRWASEGELRMEASQLLREAKKDFIDPLAAYVADVHKALESRVADSHFPDGRDNDFSKWPGGMENNEVPKKYSPSSNEKMLVEPSEFPEEFQNLVYASAESLGVEKHEGFNAILNEVLTVTYGEDTKTVKTLIGYSADGNWVPKSVVGAVSSVGVPAKPRFTMPREISDFLLLSQNWLQRRGTSFGAYLSMNLTEFLDPKNSNPAEFNKRKDRFISHMTAAFSASSPLVKLNGNLMNQIHGRSIGQMDTVLVTPIPLTPAMEMYEPTKQVLLSGLSHFTDAESRVENYFSDKTATSIEFLQAMGHGVSPMVMSSIMEPIASEWARVSANESTRSSFWRWKRARLLAESVPLDRGAFEALIKGWYIARSLHQIGREENDTLGPLIAVTAEDGKTNLAFPHPLLYSGRLQPIDYLGAVMETSIIVQALAGQTSSTDPLRPYQRLIKLGGSKDAISQELENWLSSGSGFPTSPNSPSIANKVGAGADGETRKAALTSYLKEQLELLEKDLAAHRARLSDRGVAAVYEMPIIWEILPDIKYSINELISVIDRYTPARDDEYGSLNGN